MINSGIQPLQNLAVINKILAESGGAYDGKAFGRDAIVKCVLAWSFPRNPTHPFPDLVRPSTHPLNQ